MSLCFATNNPYKLAEVRALLPIDFELLSLKDVGCELELPEEQNTLEGNARQKAMYVKEHFGVPCFADDTGLEVEALNGAPGVYSARYAGPEKDDQANCTKLIQALEHKKNRSARFRTVICLVQDHQTYYFEGQVKGTILTEFKGTMGFGYDPIFMPEGEQLTFAQMNPSQKNSLSHRGKAVKALVEFLRREL